MPVESPAPPELPGLEVKKALARLHLPLECYRELVIRFSHDHQNDAALIRNCLEVGDREGAWEAAHTLKGVAGNLSANRLYAAAATLEAALRDGGPAEATRLLPEVATCLAEVVASAEILSLTGSANEHIT